MNILTMSTEINKSDLRIFFLFMHVVSLVSIKNIKVLVLKNIQVKFMEFNIKEQDSDKFHVQLYVK